MKKILLLCVAILVGTLSASAWKPQLDKAVLLVACQNLNPAAQRTLKNYIGEDPTMVAGYLASLRKSGSNLETKGWHRLHLDTNLLPAAKDENDALVQIEKALAVIKNRKSHDTEEVTFAIRTVANLVIDMHNIANVTLESYPVSAKDFQVNTSKGTANGRKANIVPMSWRSLWTNTYTNFHSGYSPQMYTEDIELMFGDKKAEFTKGSLRDWAHDIGGYTSSVYDFLQKNDNNFLHATIQAHEYLHMSCVAKAAYRLGTLLNQYLN